MKPTIWLAALSLYGGLATAQVADTALISRYKTVYDRAIQYNDFSTAGYALTAMLVNGAPVNYEDSLALVYYRAGNLGGAYKLANQLYERNNKNLTALTLLADISGRTSEVKTSLDWYEKLCVLDGNPYNHYQLATKQFLLDRRAECRQSLQKSMADSAAAMQQSVPLDIGNGTSENVPVFAASCNMMGALAYKEKDMADAKNWYQRAKNSFPDFIIAGENLKALEAEMSPKPATAKPPATKPKQ